MVRQTLLVFLLLLGAGQLAGRGAEVPGSNELLEQPMTVDANQNVQRALREIAAQAGLTLVASEEVQGMLMIGFRDVNLKRVLNKVCESVGCHWTLTESKTLVVMPLDPVERMQRLEEELRLLHRERAAERAAENPAQASLCTQGEDGKTEVLQLRGVAHPSLLKTKQGVLRVWMCQQPEPE